MLVHILFYTYRQPYEHGPRFSEVDLLSRLDQEYIFLDERLKGVAEFGETPDARSAEYAELFAHLVDAMSYKKTTHLVNRHSHLKRFFDTMRCTYFRTVDQTDTPQNAVQHFLKVEMMAGVNDFYDFYDVNDGLGASKSDYKLS
jgi:hypothetical protein